MTASVSGGLKRCLIFYFLYERQTCKPQWLLWHCISPHLAMNASLWYLPLGVCEFSCLGKKRCRVSSPTQRCLQVLGDKMHPDGKVIHCCTKCQCSVNVTQNWQTNEETIWITGSEFFIDPWGGNYICDICSCKNGNSESDLVVGTYTVQLGFTDMRNLPWW